MPTSTGTLVRTDPVVFMERAAEGGVPLVPFAGQNWDGRILSPERTFITGIGAGTTYPDYKPAPFIVSSQHAGVDTVTVVTEGIFSYCGVKVKIDTDRHLGPGAGGNPRPAPRWWATSPRPSTARRCCPSAACGI